MPATARHANSTSFFSEKDREPMFTAFRNQGWRWLGYQDSNLGMPIPKTGALPLGDTPAVWWPERESNPRHGDFQSPALPTRSEEHTSELQSRPHLVCRL